MSNRSSDFKVGSRVKLMLGGREVRAVVVEDRGHLGVGGAQLLRVRLDIPEEDMEPVEFEVRADDVKRAA